MRSSYFLQINFRVGSWSPVDPCQCFSTYTKSVASTVPPTNNTLWEHSFPYCYCYCRNRRNCYNWQYRRHRHQHWFRLQHSTNYPTMRIRSHRCGWLNENSIVDFFFFSSPSSFFFFHRMNESSPNSDIPLTPHNCVFCVLFYHL